MQRAFLFILCFSWLVVAEPRTVFVIRHAERAGGTDPAIGISRAGGCRAAKLADMLADVNVTDVYATEVARTQQTAEFVANKFRLRTKIVPAKEYDPLIQQLRAPAKGAAVVVGHSNTLPEILQRLGAGNIPPIADTQYDLLFVVTLIDAQRSSLVTLHYPGCER